MVLMEENRGRFEFPTEWGTGPPTVCFGPTVATRGHGMTIPEKRTASAIVEAVPLLAGVFERLPDPVQQLLELADLLLLPQIGPLVPALRALCAPILIGEALQLIGELRRLLVGDGSALGPVAQFL